MSKNFLYSHKIKRLSKLYKEETIRYVAQVNEFREEGMESKWEEPLSKEYSADTRVRYAQEIYEAILHFNKNGETQKLRELFPPQIDIFYNLAHEKESVSHIYKILAISDEIFLVAVDEPKFSVKKKEQYHKRTCYMYFLGDFEVLDNVLDFAVCPQKKVFAYIYSDEIILKNGWDGQILSTINLLGNTTIYFADNSIALDDFDFSELSGELYIPFSDGKKILIGDEYYGLLMLENNKCTLVFPCKQDIINLKQKREENPSEDDDYEWGPFHMLHASLSYNNKYIALGHQFGNHLLYSVDGVCLGESETLSEYPHYALFSKDDSQIMFNSFYLYNGLTFGCKREDMMICDPVAEDKIIELDMESRVFAAISTSFGYIIGDTYGYIRARSHDGDYLWDDYLGFNISTIDITPDERFLFVGSYRGVIHKIHLNYGERSPYEIGNSKNREVLRWMFWEENNILKW